MVHDLLLVCHCKYLVSFPRQREKLDEIAIFSYTAFDPPLRVSRRNIAIRFYVKKTRMVWLTDGKKVWKYVYSFRHNTRTWQTLDRQTDRQTDSRTPHDGSFFHRTVAQSLWFYWHQTSSQNSVGVTHCGGAIYR